MPNQMLNLSQPLLNYDHKLQKPFLVLVIVIHTFILALGILGNSLVVYFFLFNIKLRNVRNAFMVNLTFSNLLLLTICTPSFLLTLIFPSWTLGSFWCKFSHSIQIVFVLVCAFSIMMIAIDRWMFVVYSRSRQLNTRDSILIIVGMWLLAIVISAPTFYFRLTKELYDEKFKSFISSMLQMNKMLVSNGDQYYPSMTLSSELITENKLYINNNNDNITITTTKTATTTQNVPQLPSPMAFKFDSNNLHNLESIASNNLIYCVEDWPQPIYKRIYILVLFTLEFVLPCICILVTYIWIIRFLKANDNKMSHYEILRIRLIQKERPHQKNCKLLSALCITFITCYLPLSLFNIKAEFMMGTKADKDIYSPLTILTTLEVLNTIASPLLYGWMNHNFRNEINQKMSLLKSKYRKVNTQNFG